MKTMNILALSILLATAINLHQVTASTKVPNAPTHKPRMTAEIGFEDFPRPSLSELLGPLGEVSSLKIVSSIAVLIGFSGVVYRVATMNKEDTEKGFLGKHQWPLYLLASLTGLAGLGMYLAP